MRCTVYEVDICKTMAAGQNKWPLAPNLADITRFCGSARKNIERCKVGIEPTSTATIEAGTRVLFRGILEYMPL